MAVPKFLLVHSPLVSSVTWMPVASILEASGYEVMLVALDNRIAQGESYHAHHLAIIDSSLAGCNGQGAVAVGHSGAGNLLALLNPEKIAGYVFVDATFPMVASSRFGLFDDPDAHQSWQALAERHAGMLPTHRLVRFGDQIQDATARAAFVAGIADVPVALYEEIVPVHRSWPPQRPGLYVQWSGSYAQDTIRAANAGLELRAEPASHFKMLDMPAEVAQMLIEFALAER